MEVKTHSDTVATRPSLTTLAPYEVLAVEAIGYVIETWGFKRNQGRVWALLFLRGSALSAREIREPLDLSKGAVSMILHELERWGVVSKERPTGSQSRGLNIGVYSAQTDLMAMIGRVIREREGAMLTTVRKDLETAYAQAKSAGNVSKEELRRLGQLRMLAKTVERAVRLFLDSARLDVRGAFDLLIPSSRRR